MIHTSRFKYAGSIILAGLVLFAPLRASALSLDEVEDKSDEELTESGWEMREVNANPNAVKCGIISIFASLVWRGYGHYCIDDMSSHYKLLGMEGASLAMFATSLMMGSLSNNDKALSGTWKTLFHFGTTLFIASYIFDVLGTFKGNSFILSENHLDPYGNTVDLNLRWLPSSDIDLGLMASYTYRNPRMWASVNGYVDITSISEFSFGIDTGVALWRGEKNYTYVALALDGKYDDQLDDDYQSLKFIPYIEFSLDLGSWFDHLENFRFINRLGVGVQLYDFEFSETTPFTTYDTVLVLETTLSLNVIRDLNLAVTYRYRPDYVVGQLSAPSRIFKNSTQVPGFGIFSLDLSFKFSDTWSASLEGNFGESIDFWIGVSTHFGGPKKEIEESAIQ